jgi:hypothetical protein
MIMYNRHIMEVLGRCYEFFTIRLSEEGRCIVSNPSCIKDFQDFVRSEFSGLEESGPGSFCKPPVAEPLEQPLVGILGVLLTYSGLQFEQPLAVEFLL